MKKLKEFRFKTWHFSFLLALLFLGINIWGPITVNGTSNNLSEDIHFEELKDMSGIESSDIVSVIFYQENSEVCNKMMHNISKLSRDDVKFYRVNVNEHPDIYKKYNISGVPCTLLFKNGQEIDRIMGVVPVTNLEIIYKRATK
ncbi:MAG: thioredoxin family protein [Dysgonomonas sp.]